MRLFDLSHEIEAVLIATVDRETGEISEDGVAALETLELALNEKALAIARFVLGLEAEADAIDAQAKRLRERATVHRNHAARLRLYVEANVPPGTKIADDCVALSWRKSSAVIVDAEADVPEKFWKIEMRVDKKAVGDAIKAGADIPGAHIEQRLGLVIR